jgi:release factor glutamine methyltransferase
MIIAERLAEIAWRLAPVTDTPRYEAELLCAHAQQVTRSALLADLRNACAPDLAENLLQRRLKHEPIAYILGTQEFFSLEFIVKPPLLIPRPETEHLVETALDFLSGRPGRVLDLCTGTGCVGLTIGRELPGCELWLTDKSPTALAVAHDNARQLGVIADFWLGDLYDPLLEEDAPFDVIVSNPPYVATGEWDDLEPDIREYEDPGALLAGEDGLDIIRRIIAEAPVWLRLGGLLAIEVGETQAEEVQKLMVATSFEDVAAVKDLAGIDRIMRGVLG